MGYREQFTPTQWRALQLAPFLVLSGICGRCRDFPVEETIVFERWLDEASRAPGTLSGEVLSSVSADMSAVLADYESFPGTIVSGLTTVIGVLVGQPLDEIDAFREALIHVLGEGIARARGPYGKQITTESAQMLLMLEEFLRPDIVFAA